jgi:hypothetical protein
MSSFVRKPHACRQANENSIASVSTLQSLCASKKRIVPIFSGTSSRR